MSGWDLNAMQLLGVRVDGISGQIKDLQTASIANHTTVLLSHRNIAARIEQLHAESMRAIDNVNARLLVIESTMAAASASSAAPAVPPAFEAAALAAAALAAARIAAPGPPVPPQAAAAAPAAPLQTAAAATPAAPAAACVPWDGPPEPHDDYPRPPAPAADDNYPHPNLDECNIRMPQWAFRRLPDYVHIGKTYRLFYCRLCNRQLQAQHGKHARHEDRVRLAIRLGTEQRYKDESRLNLWP